MISIVVPVFNEEESLEAFYNELVLQLDKLGDRYEIIFIDDGSTDASLSILKKLEKENKLIRVFSFRRNLGKSEALTLGFTKAQGDLIVTLDADLQDQPSEIEKLIEKYKEGYDLVTGWKKTRKDKTKMVIISRIFNAVVSKLFGLRLHDYNCGLKLYTSEVAKNLRLYGGLHRFIPVLAYEQGFSVAEVPVVHEARKYGSSKYGFSKLWKDLPDLFTTFFLTKYNKRPLHFFWLLGTFFAVIGTLILLYFMVQHTFFRASVGDRPLLFIGLILVIAGFQVFFTGFLADLMINLGNRPEHLDQQYFPLKYSSDKIK